MRFGSIVVILVLFFTCLAEINAQDLIVKKSGEVIQARVVEITDDQIKYKRYDNLTGPMYSTTTSSVYSVRFENGIVEQFGGEATTPKKEGSSGGPVIKEIKGRSDKPLHLDVSNEGLSSSNDFMNDKLFLLSWGIGAGKATHVSRYYQNKESVRFPEMVIKVEVLGNKNFSLGFMWGINSVRENDNSSLSYYDYTNFYFSGIVSYYLDTGTEVFPYLGMGIGISSTSGARNTYEPYNDGVFSKDIYTTGFIGLKYKVSENIGLFVDTRSGYPIHALAQVGITLQY